ncbi:MAG: hypothetical protein KDC66_00155 [Phaeodactylibacter sp.]|nr:hypothetical protein [Phaeodactylibacter sp.]MCB9273694.1 hypothetical protein [Lewinellaceae bacterium]
MVNTIAVSTDMETLYLIDDNRAIAFPLLGTKGIIIGLLDGQLTVATAAQPPKMDMDIENPTNGDNAARVVSSDGRVKIVKLPITNTAWSTVFDRKKAALCFIGATEVEIRVSGGDELEFKASLEFFELNKGNIYVRRTKDSIVVVSLPFKEDKGTNA